MSSDDYAIFISKYNAVEGRDLDRLKEVELVGYYLKNFELCTIDKLLDDINRRVVPYVLGMRVLPTLQAINYGRAR